MYKIFSVLIFLHLFFLWYKKCLSSQLTMQWSGEEKHLCSQFSKAPLSLVFSSLFREFLRIKNKRNLWKIKGIFVQLHLIRCFPAHLVLILRYDVMSLLKTYTWKRTRSKYIFYILFWTQWINLVYLSDSTLLSNQILIKRTSYMLSQWPKKLITFIEEETEALFSQNLAITENSFLFWLKIFFRYWELANSASSFKSS